MCLSSFITIHTPLSPAPAGHAVGTDGINSTGGICDNLSDAVDQFKQLLSVFIQFFKCHQGVKSSLMSSLSLSLSLSLSRGLVCISINI